MPDVVGRVSASFDVTGGLTRMRSHHHAYPLKIAKTFRFPQQQLGVYVMDASPGMMAGDRYELDWEFGEGSCAYVTNQSYTKVHPPRAPGSDIAELSVQNQSFRLAAGAYVEYMPEPVMLYRDAGLWSRTEVRLGSGASFLSGEILCPGRTYRGEQFGFRLYRNRLAVYEEDELIYYNQQRVEPDHGAPQTIGRWGSLTHAGSLLLFSERADAPLAEALRGHLEECFTARGELSFGISLTAKHGLVLNALGGGVLDLQRLLHQAWSFVRSELFGLTVWTPPK
ncbi:urease accessory protein UreD [Paenibacillus filicis]|uniref:Urease accessory protein UreD n=2 Tax=Paenibacillus filicis TaxID=669464 RepID=A0ABU9DUB9_9BACL